MMRFRVRDFTDEDARATTSWRYEPPLDFYDADRFPEDLAEFLDPAGWPGTYFAVGDEDGDEAGELVGFFEFRGEGDEVTIGLGLRPDLTGKGLGLAFTEAAIGFAAERWAPRVFRLEVASWNERAIRVYERVGFRRDGARVHRYDDGSEVEFLQMSLARDAT